MHQFGPSLREGNVGVIPPPPGTRANLKNPPSLEHLVLIVNIILPIVSGLFVILRFYTTRYILQSVSMDDYITAVAWVLACLSSTTDCLLIRYGLGRHLWDVPFSAYNINFLKWAAICGAFYGLSIMLSKLALLRLYLRYSAQKPTVFIWATATVVILYSLVASFQWTFACRPLEKFWDLRIAYGSCIEWSNIAVFSGAMNTATDIIILLLPIFILRHLRLPRRDKFMVALAMMTGGFVVIVSGIRLKKTIDMAHGKDITWNFVTNGTWWMVEMHVALSFRLLSWRYVAGSKNFYTAIRARAYYLDRRGAVASRDSFTTNEGSERRR